MTVRSGPNGQSPTTALRESRSTEQLAGLLVSQLDQFVRAVELHRAALVSGDLD